MVNWKVELLIWMMGVRYITTQRLKQWRSLHTKVIDIKSKIKCNTKGDRNWRHIAITPGRLTSLVAKPRRWGESPMRAGIRQLLASSWKVPNNVLGPSFCSKTCCNIQHMWNLCIRLQIHPLLMLLEGWSLHHYLGKGMKQPTSLPFQHSQ